MALCVERKATLSGRTEEFRCDLLLLQPGFGVLRYVIDRTYDVAGTRLQPGDTTYALYWTDRPYTLYVWETPTGRSYYFNIADSIILAPALFTWRDLAVDILIDDAGNVHILDEDEVPADLPPGLSAFIAASKATVLACWRSVVAEADAILLRLAVPGR